MIKRILTYSNENDRKILSSLSKEVAEEDDVEEIVQNLKDTLEAAQGSSGVGLSAVQIGILKRICIINYGGEKLTLINPKITWIRNGPHSEKEFEEGCLSVPGISVKISRPQKIICEYLNEKKELKTIKEGGWMSAIIQHEIDHMNGISKLYTLLSQEKEDK